MNNILNFLFEDIEGKWIYSHTFYCLSNKFIKNNKYNITITKLNSCNNLSSINSSFLYKSQYEYKKLNKETILWEYFYNGNDIKNSNIIKKMNSSHNNQYTFKVYKKKYVRINYNHNIFKYSEYIYIINTNLRISFILIKKNDKCMAISFTSQIKIHI